MAVLYGFLNCDRNWGFGMNEGEEALNSNFFFIVFFFFDRWHLTPLDSLNSFLSYFTVILGDPHHSWQMSGLAN